MAQRPTKILPFVEERRGGNLSQLFSKQGQAQSARRTISNNALKLRCSFESREKSGDSMATCKIKFTMYVVKSNVYLFEATYFTYVFPQYDILDRIDNWREVKSSRIKKNWSLTSLAIVLRILQRSSDFDRKNTTNRYIIIIQLYNDLLYSRSAACD